VKLQQIIASSCRQKILLALLKTKRTHITNLVRMINSTYNEVNRNLEILEKEEIIDIRFYGRMRMVELRVNNPRTQIILQALRLLDDQKNPHFLR
jgi:DNA-binding transcriptional ArsR family regulator